MFNNHLAKIAYNINLEFKQKIVVERQVLMFQHFLSLQQRL